VTDFLSRIVQRAAGLPAHASAPAPPSPFQWPPALDAAVTHPQHGLVHSHANRRIVTPSAGPKPDAEVAERPHVNVADLPAPEVPDVRPDVPADRPSAISPAASTYASPAEAHVFNPSHEPTMVTRSMPAGIEPLLGRQAADHHEAALVHSEPTTLAHPLPTAATHARSARPTTPAAQTADVMVRPPVSVPPSIEHANSELNEPTDQSLPEPIRSHTGTQPIPPALHTPRRSARGEAFQEASAPVEVKIGSVEIVFDQPAVQTAQPPPARPNGFADFADLRRYAARPWSLSRR
jgi:hypothetical protein